MAAGAYVAAKTQDGALDLAALDEAAAGDFQQELAAQEANTILDSVLYTRRQGKKGAVSTAKSWLEFGFTSRPDWWGQAATIGFKDFTYEMLEPEPEKEPEVPAAS